MNRQDALKRIERDRAAGVFAADRLNPLIADYYQNFAMRLQQKLRWQAKRQAAVKRERLLINGEA
jgi:hypothetical protein